MFNSGIIDVVIGLTVIYIQLSLVCTAISELIAAVLRKRANDLEQGIRTLLNDKSDGAGFLERLRRRFRKSETGNSITSKFYGHHLITALRPNGKTPSYIPAKTFALTLIDLIRSAPQPQPPPAKKPETSPEMGTTTQPTTTTTTTAASTGTGTSTTEAARALQDLKNKVGSAVDTIQGLEISPELKKAVRILIEDAGNDLDKARVNIETWFNDAMDRVSGWYKRKSQITIFVIAAFVTVMANIDTIRIADALASNKALRDTLVAAAPALAQRAVQTESTPKPTPAQTPTPRPTPAQSTTPGTSPATTPAAGATQTPQTNPPGEVSENVGQPSDNVGGGNNVGDKSVGERIDDIKTSLKELEKYDLPIGWIEPCQPTPTPTPLASAAATIASATPTPTPAPSPAGCKENFSPEDVTRRFPGYYPGYVKETDPYPVGWGAQLANHWLGWLLTAAALSLGAPFWFDLLNRLMVIRSTVKPREKSPEQKSKDETVGDDDGGAGEGKGKTKGKT